jgi:hypothetical protein
MKEELTTTSLNQKSEAEREDVIKATLWLPVAS